MKKNRYSAILLLFLSFCLYLGCKKEEQVIETTLILSPDELMINDNETGKLFLSTQPQSQEFEWNVTTKPAWLNLSPSSGTIKDKNIEITVTPNPTGLSLGKYTGTIEIITNGAGKAKCSVTVCVDARPKAKVDPSSIHFAANETQKKFKVTNTGTGFLNWKLESPLPWLSFNITSGFLDQGESIEITATAQRGGLPVGSQTGKVTLSSNAQDSPNLIDFSLDVPQLAIISASVGNLQFGYFEDKKTFFLKNRGNAALNWNISNAQNYLSFSPTSGTLGIGDSVAVQSSVDRSTLSSQTYNSSITIGNPQGQSFALPVVVKNYKEEKWLIAGKVLDAEYDRVNDVLVAVSEAPNEIRKFNVATQAVEALALNQTPSCVSISQDGKYAAVGHNGSFSYIDLSTMQLVKTYAITTHAIDIVLAPNKWVYIFPRTDQWETIRCVNLTTGVEKMHIGNSIYAGTLGKLHPSGTAIYGANNGLSPSDFEKYSIGGGTAQFLYDSPYHGDYSFGGDLWISDDGNRLFARSRNVFNSSTTQANDMTYSGELVGTGFVSTLDHSTKAQRVYAVFSSGDFWNPAPDKEVRKYDTNFLSFKGTVSLPAFLIPDGNGSGTFFDAQGHFGFFNSAGTKFHVLVKATEGSGAQNEWAIATVNVD